MSSSLHTLLFCFLHVIHQSRTLNEAEWGPIQIYSKYHKSIWQKALSFKTIFQNLLAAVFKQNWWDQLFEYEHVLQLVRMCVRVNRLHSPHVVSLPSFCIKTIPPTGSDRPVMFCCFCFEEQCDVLCDQLIWMCTLFTSSCGYALPKTHTLFVVLGSFIIYMSCSTVCLTLKIPQNKLWFISKWQFNLQLAFRLAVQVWI